MDPLIGAAVTGIAVAVTYKLARRHSSPAKSKPRPAKKAWLVHFVGSAGVPTESTDLKSATAEWSGRAAGKLARGGRKRSQRAWTAVKTAAERSRTTRETRWQDQGRQPLLFKRQPKAGKQDSKPAATKPVEPTAVLAPPQGTPGPEPPKERHLKAVPDPKPAPGGAVTTTNDAVSTTLAAPDAPPDWALMIDRVSHFHPEDDAALVAFMHGEAAAMVRYAEALEQARETCTNDVGLDPTAVAGFTDYSEHVSDAAERMSEAWKTFIAVYGEVQRLAADGVTLPYNGRFFTGSTA
ncbi:hypothetical protein ACIBHX_02205 [Nonomuraea sp. NPDC050536]|uniref:hypothetical protein n=1 Tax=Nonomuraea sp. NPDC050536 TaxID=3364366 RepID=UPI0037C7496B